MAGTKKTLLLFVLLPVFAAAAVGPRIEFDRETLDYGKVLSGETVTGEFIITNSGDADLVIEKLRATCGCTKAVKGSSVVPPGGKSKIMASFDTSGLSSGQRKKHIFVTTNDPNRSEVKLTIQATVVKKIVIEPRRLARDLPSVPESVPFNLTISNADDRDVTVTGVRITGAEVTGMLNPSEFTVKAGAKMQFVLVLKPGDIHDQSVFAGKAYVKTDHPRERETPIRYFVRIGQPKR